MREEKGVTLISLVITIIILIILAGISINMTIGENGLITKAKQAKENMEIATNEEKEKLEELTNEMEEIQNEEDIETMPKVTVGETASENSTINGKDGSYYNPVIPKGFKAIDTESAKWTEESGYQNGLVIEDDTKDSTTQGSQFVWVPVANYDNFHLIEGYMNGSLASDLTSTTDPAREAGASKTEKIPQAPNAGKNTLLGTDESVAMFDSVKTYGGFYIARYEAGIDGTTSSTITNDANKQTKNGTIKPVSKARVGVWNFIQWGGTESKEATDGESGNDRADGAVKVARSMYNNPVSGSVNNATTVKSTLCYSVQWDATMNFIDPNYLEGKCETNSFVRNSNNKGNYTGTIAVAGDKEEYAQKNIYDLAGNLQEWTMEACYTGYRFVRGSNYSSDGVNVPASTRYGHRIGTMQAGLGFRVTLYL